METGAPWRERLARWARAGHRIKSNGRGPVAALAPLPQEPEEHAHAGGDQHGLEGLLVDVGFEALFPLGRALAALVVVLRGLVAELVVAFRGLVADLAAEVAEVLADLGRRVGEALTALALPALVPLFAGVRRVTTHTRHK